MILRIISFLIVCLLSISSFGQSTTNTPFIFKMQEDNTLRFDIIVEEPSVTSLCYKIKEKDFEQFFIEKCMKQPLKKETIYGLKAETDFEAEITYNKSGTKETINKFFKTGGLPDQLTDFDLKYSNPKFTFDGYIGLSILAKYEQNRNLPNINNPSGSARNPKTYDATEQKGSYLVLLNKRAEIVWYQYVPKNVRPFNWTADNTVLAMSEGNAIYEYNLAGDLLMHITNDEIVEKVGQKVIFDRDILKNEKGNYVILVAKDDSVQLDNGRYKFIQKDKIFVIDKFGNSSWEWETIGEREVNNNKSYYRRQANSMIIDDNGNYILSIRDDNQVWCVDSKTGDVLWKLGEGGDLEMDASSYFKKQHGAFMQDGILYLYNNNTPSGTINYNALKSKAMAFKIDAENKKAETVIDIALNKMYVSPRQSSFIPMIENYYLGSSTYSAKTFVLDSKGNVYWDLNCPTASFRAVYVKSIH